MLAPTQQSQFNLNWSCAQSRNFRNDFKIYTWQLSTLFRTILVRRKIGLNVLSNEMHEFFKYAASF